MFDLSFPELLVIGVVALIVVGPDRLPRMARTAGLFVGRARRTLREIRADVERELALEDLRRAGRTLPAQAEDASAAAAAPVTTPREDADAGRTTAPAGPG